MTELILALAAVCAIKSPTVTNPQELQRECVAEVLECLGEAVGFPHERYAKCVRGK